MPLPPFVVYLIVLLTAQHVTNLKDPNEPSNIIFDHLFVWTNENIQDISFNDILTSMNYFNFKFHIEKLDNITIAFKLYKASKYTKTLCSYTPNLIEIQQNDLLLMETAGILNPCKYRVDGKTLYQMYSTYKQTFENLMTSSFTR